ncbi:hypothetical protein [Helicobacter cetorum]|uniref:hypothetical protein n=1 Tax=Helicobacter cetorum TaxID=138563 RepID=UPI000CF0459E|nr:hypothetical protein [Helicobacter cetorum]
MKTNLFKGLGVLSLALAMPLFGSAPIDVSMGVEDKLSAITNSIYQQPYLNIQSNVDNIVIQNIELNRGNCKDEMNNTIDDFVIQQLGHKDSYVSLKNYEKERAEILQQLKDLDSRVLSQGDNALFLGTIIYDKGSIIEGQDLYNFLSPITTYDELIDKLQDKANYQIREIIESSYPEIILTNFYPQSDRERKNKKLYSLKFFYGSLDYIWKYGRDLDLYTCKEINVPLVLDACMTLSKYNEIFQYYLSDYVKSIVGDEYYNKLTSSKHWDMAKKWDTKSIEFQEFGQSVWNSAEKLKAAYLPELKKQISLNIKELQKDISTLQQKLRNISQQERSTKQKQLSQKLTQLNQKIKSMKEQGNTIRVPLKFGQVFKTRACSNLKEAKIKTDKGTYTFSF